LISWLCGFWRDLQDDSFWWYEGLNSGPCICLLGRCCTTWHTPPAFVF
jgi:hypothetical protein